jgi:hypothetical protein
LERRRGGLGGVGDDAVTAGSCGVRRGEEERRRRRRRRRSRSRRRRRVGGRGQSNGTIDKKKKDEKRGERVRMVEGKGKEEKKKRRTDEVKSRDCVVLVPDELLERVSDLELDETRADGGVGVEGELKLLGDLDGSGRLANDADDRQGTRGVSQSSIQIKRHREGSIGQRQGEGSRTYDVCAVHTADSTLNDVPELSAGELDVNERVAEGEGCKDVRLGDFGSRDGRSDAAGVVDGGSDVGSFGSTGCDHGVGDGV